MERHVTKTTFRVRYSETDRMGTIYNGRVLEWFGVGRTELMRELGTPYAEMEKRGVLLPLVEAHVRYEGRATYDDELEMHTRARMVSRLRVRFEVEIRHAGEGAPVASGYTVHAVTDGEGRPSRPPEWFVAMFEPATD